MTDQPGAKLVNSVILTLVARGAIIVATAVGLPAAGWMMNRAVESVDKISIKVDAIKDQSIETGGTLKLIQQSQDVQRRMIDDHEARVRVLENYSRNNPIRN